MSNIFVVCGIDMIIDYKGYRIVAFSDTHGMRRYLETPTDADIWIYAGDCINTFSIQEFRDFLSWYASIPAQLRLFVNRFLIPGIAVVGCKAPKLKLVDGTIIKK